MIDFDEIIDRRQTNSTKWVYGYNFLQPEQAAADPLPMWVADMDFRIALPIKTAMEEVLHHGIPGYCATTPAYIEAVTQWQKTRHNWQVDPDWLVLSPGVVTMLNMIIQALSEPGDSILIQPPVYVHFHQDIVANGREIAWAPLRLEGNSYHFDAEIFENSIKNNTKLFILSNPHNPTGNVWSAEDLKIMGDICAKHGIIVISDEIHADLVLDKTKKHIPFASLGEDQAQNSITCTAASKSFNLAGLQCSNNYIPNARLRQIIMTHMQSCGIASVNIMGRVATQAAYAQGAPWLDCLLNYLRDNQNFFRHQINEAGLPLTVFPMESLYLAWLDCRQMDMEAAELFDFMLRKARVWFDDGRKFGPQGHGFLRVNLGCPRHTVEQAITRLKMAFP